MTRRHTGPPCLQQTFIFFVGNDPDPVIFLRDFFQQLRRTVCGAVIHGDDLNGKAVIAGHGADAPCQCFFRIVNGDEYAEKGFVHFLTGKFLIIKFINASRTLVS